MSKATMTLEYRDACENKVVYNKDSVRKAARVNLIKLGRKLKPYQCPNNPDHWHLGRSRHLGRIAEPHTLCNTCKRDIRDKRYEKHIAKCTGINNGPREDT